MWSSCKSSIRFVGLRPKRYRCYNALQFDQSLLARGQLCRKTSSVATEEVVGHHVINEHFRTSIIKLGLYVARSDISAGPIDKKMSLLFRYGQEMQSSEYIIAGMLKQFSSSELINLRLGPIHPFKLCFMNSIKLEASSR